MKTKNLYISGIRYTYLGFRPYSSIIEIPSNIHKEYSKIEKRDITLAKQYILQYCKNKVPSTVKISNIMFER